DVAKLTQVFCPSAVEAQRQSLRSQKFLDVQVDGLSQVNLTSQAAADAEP
ncbi:14927_t:CDS:2, partial [Dentiscutata erythropus]